MSFFGFGKKKDVPQPPPALDPKMALRAEVAKKLLGRAYDVAENCDGICDNPVFRQHVIALGHTITAAVAAICFNEIRYFNDPPFYADIWQRHESWFGDLAAFLSYWFVCHEMPPDDPERDVSTPELLSVAATVYGVERVGRFSDSVIKLREPIVCGHVLVEIRLCCGHGGVVRYCAMVPIKGASGVVMGSLEASAPEP